MTEHSPERWIVTDVSNKTDLLPGYKIKDNLGEEISRLEPYDDRAFGMADAERIVACINACAGIPTEHLKEVIEVGLRPLRLFKQDISAISAVIGVYLSCIS